MREELVKLFPSQLHCCISDAKMDAPLKRARFSMNAIVTFCYEAGMYVYVCVCVCVRYWIKVSCSVLLFIMQ